MKQPEDVGRRESLCNEALESKREKSFFLIGKIAVKLRVTGAEEVATAVVGPVSAEDDCKRKTGRTSTDDNDFVVL
jgi:hypothetical protein